MTIPHKKAPNKTLQIRPSPHISGGASVEKIMANVILALMPTVLFAIYLFGLAALVTILIGTFSCLLTEYLFCKANGKPSSISDNSIIITGVLYSLTLPPGLPLWMVCIGGIIAVLLGKLLFGGLGYNLFNPALVGRAFLQAAFPSAMTTWYPAMNADRFTSLPLSTLTFPFTTPSYDTISSATPLAAMKFDQILTDSSDLFLGLSSGSLGETSSLLILTGGIYLIARRMMRWQIPAGIFITVVIISTITHNISPNTYPSAQFMLFSGGLMLGAMFMATDMVASPITAKGCFIYGLLIGVLVMIIRLWGGMPEGVMYAILFANAVSPHIDRWTQPRPYGYRKTKS